MLAKKIKCQVLAKNWLTPTVFEIRFSTAKKIKFQGGQFLSIYAPDQKTGKEIRRAYSFSSSPEFSYSRNSYELCIKLVPGGAGSEYLSKLNPGDSFEAMAPYGHFVYHPPQNKRNVCFISTSTGVAPFRSMLLSEEFHEHAPEKCFFIFGARDESEFLYKEDLEIPGVEVILAASQPDETFEGFHGRVTDYLRSLPNSWHWHQTDFYLCGSPEMVREVTEILMAGHGVDDKSIHRESFAAPKKKAANVA